MNETGSGSHGTINNNDRSFDMDSLRHALSSDQRHGSATPTIGGSYAVLSQNVRMNNTYDLIQLDSLLRYKIGRRRRRRQ